MAAVWTGANARPLIEQRTARLSGGNTAECVRVCLHTYMLSFTLQFHTHAGKVIRRVLAEWDSTMTMTSGPP